MMSIFLRKIRVLIFFVLFNSLCWLSSTAFAATDEIRPDMNPSITTEKTAPETVANTTSTQRKSETITKETSAMKPSIETMIEAQLAKAVDPETAKRISTFKKNLYDALIKDGFTHQEAMSIVVATPIPTATPSVK